MDYTCCTKARQGESGCPGRTVPMEKLDKLVAEYIEQRLLQPGRLERLLSHVLDRRKDCAERRKSHIAELRKRASEADAKLKRLYDAIENGPKRFELLPSDNAIGLPWRVTMTE